MIYPKPQQSQEWNSGLWDAQFNVHRLPSKNNAHTYRYTHKPGQGRVPHQNRKVQKNSPIWFGHIKWFTYSSLVGGVCFLIKDTCTSSQLNYIFSMVTQIALGLCFTRTNFLLKGNAIRWPLRFKVYSRPSPIEATSQDESPFILGFW